jgi:hypothetical protein
MLGAAPIAILLRAAQQTAASPPLSALAADGPALACNIVGDALLESVDPWMRRAGRGSR